MSQNKTERTAYKQSPSENNWSTKREEWRQRDLQNVIPNSFKEKEKNCSEITRIALTKREDIEAFCPHTTMPEYACFLQSDLKLLLHCKLWFHILYMLIWCLNLMLLVDKDAFGPFSLHIFQIWSLVLEFSSLTKRCFYPLVQSPFLIVADCIPDQFFVFRSVCPLFWMLFAGMWNIMTFLNFVTYSCL